MANVLIVDDDAALREGLAETVADLGHAPRVAASGREALAALVGDNIDCVLLDLRMPGGMDGIEVLRRIREGNDAPPVIVLTAFATAENTIEAMRLGAFDHLTKPIGRLELDALLKRLPQRGIPLAADGPGENGTLIGSSEAMRRVQKAIGLAADRDATVLILGETGTGKETIARMIHESSPRSQQPFIPVNCANFTDSLLESQLFGHEKGAFTGADTRKEGVFELADGGTLFLDEIGEMPLKLQASLLRVLETGRFRRLGGKEEVRVDVRIISATHHDLLEDVKKRQFREDLYYRLSTVPVKAPALREVPEDIPHIAQDLVYRCCFSRGMQAWKLTKDQERTLRGYSWPGNVRELLNVIERAIVLGERDFSKLLNLDTERSPGRFGARRSFDPSDIRPLDQVEREYVLQVYEAAGRNKTRAAKLIGLSLNTLKKKLNEAAG